ncbi:MAG: hypothetical protein H6712_03740 [Myxococcales bacterium]|nr:hypothetical protein [Myxococcales bacterium]MCB9712938.1 hypothetical protein [Myxococcales bacterium]
MSDPDDRASTSTSSALPELRVGSVLDPVTLEALDDVRRRQLEIASRLYSGREESAEAILQHGDEDQDERIHPRFLELRTIVGPDGAPRYDAWLYMVDSGSIFAAGTLDVVAEVIQFGLETDDEALEQALDPLLGKLPTSKQEVAPQGSTTQSAGKTKVVAKTAGKKKVVSKTATTKKTAANKE